MKTEHLGIEIFRRKDGVIVLTEPVYFSPYPRDTRFMGTAILPGEALGIHIHNPLYAYSATDAEIVDWWLASLSRKTLLHDGAPDR